MSPTAVPKPDTACITQVRKRDGRIVLFDQQKITTAIFKAAQAIGGTDYELAERLGAQVIEDICSRFKDSIPTVEQIQDSVETILIKTGHAKTAKAFILYRHERTMIREAKKEILGGLVDTSHLNLNQLRIAEAKYLMRDDNGKVIETPDQMFRRVANALAQPERAYGGEEAVKKAAETFYTTFSKLEFLPGGRTISNAGIGCNQLANCFVLPVGDSMEEIFDAVKWQALVQKTGGGTGFDFSRLRTKGSRVVKSNGVASGPVTFITVFDAATSVIMQGNRRGANMGILRIDHPDVLEFVTMKDDLTKLNNFNISISVTNTFMEALENGEEYDLVDPHTHQVVKRLDARYVWRQLYEHAWKTGEPGIIFIDRINERSTVRHLGEIRATNPCGEVPLLDFEVCNLGSVNLSLCVKNGTVDFERLRRITRTGVWMLDNVIDAGTYPLPQITEMAQKTRRIGLGVLGFADMLYQLGIGYNTDEGVELGEKVMEFIEHEAHNMSQELAEKKGVFPAWKGSTFEKEGIPMRNCAVTSIAPTGTLSMLGDTSGGIEPNFAICFIKNSHSLGQQFVYVNKYFEKVAKERGFYTPDLMKKIAEKGSLHGIMEVPEDVKAVFVTAHDISPVDHIRMQAAFQKNVDNAISKTINFANYAAPEDVQKGYLLAWKLGCKGCTVYRDGSRQNQVLNIKEVNVQREQVEEVAEQPDEVPPKSVEVIFKTVSAKEESVLSSKHIVAIRSSKPAVETMSTLDVEALTKEALLANAAAFVEESAQKMSNPAKVCIDCGVKLDDHP